MKIITGKQYFYITGISIFIPVISMIILSILVIVNASFYIIGLFNILLFFVAPLILLILFLCGIFLAKKNNEHRQSFIVGSIINIISLFFLLWVLSGFLVHIGEPDPIIIYPSTDEG